MPTRSSERLPPEQVLPRAFALFGAAAGLFAIFTMGAFREAARDVLPLTPLVVTAIIGAVAGRALGRLQSSEPHDASLEVTVVRVGGTAVAAGALSGGFVGFTTWGMDGIARFAVGGALVGALLYPGCHAVFRASLRAARARLGSLVADADRRTVTSTLWAGAAVLAALQVPALLSLSLSARLPPIVQVTASLLVCGAAVATILRMRQLDARDRASLERVHGDAAWLRPAAEASAVARDVLDLGVGDGYFVHGAAENYRAAPAEAKLRGSIAEARGAFDECQRARHYALLVASAALVQVMGATVLRASALLPGVAR